MSGISPQAPTAGQPELNYAYWLMVSLEHAASLIHNWVSYFTMDDGPGASNPLRNKILLVLIPALLDGAGERAAGRHLPTWVADATAAADLPALAVAELIQAHDDYVVELCSIFTKAEMEWITFQRTHLVHGHARGARAGGMGIRWVENGAVQFEKNRTAEQQASLFQEGVGGQPFHILADGLRHRFMSERSKLWPLVRHILDVPIIWIMGNYVRDHSEGRAVAPFWEQTPQFKMFRGKLDPDLMQPYSLLEARAQGWAV